jgi:predicted extracellular nuclease
MKKLLLSVSVLFAVTANSQDCSELFISEYIEGPGNNNAIEIYNPTNNPIDLSGYTINRYGNGATSSPDVWPLSGTLNTGEAIAIGNGQVDSIWVSSYWSLPVDSAFYSACGINGSGI